LRIAALPWLVAQLGQPWMGAAARLMTRLHGGSLPMEDRGYLRRMNATPGSARAFARSARDVIDWRGQRRHLLDRAEEISVLPPIALFWGERDHIIPIQHGEQICTVLENTPLHRFPRHGHFLHWSAPDELAAALLGYLDAREAPNAVLRRGA
jgi:pimeloyl-ACP methyl ester carboxylesterase